MASKRKPLVDADEVRKPLLAAGERTARRAWAAALIGVLAVVAVAVPLAAIVAGKAREGDLAVAIGLGSLLLTLVAVVLGGTTAGAAQVRARLAAARALLEAGCHDAAIIDLKALHREPLAADEASYLVALSYDRQGARRLAIESYRAYLATHPAGAWVVEAKVRVEELELGRVADSLDVKSRESEGETCPFCKSSVTDEATVTCDACGTTHHAGCWQEQGGCSVYGCASRDAKAAGKVRES